MKLALSLLLLAFIGLSLIQLSTAYQYKYRHGSASRYRKHTFRGKSKAHLHSRHRHRQNVGLAPPLPTDISSPTDNFNGLELELDDGQGFITYNKFLDLMRNRHLTVGEVHHLFETIDLDKNNQISTKEWHDFYVLFVEPFETVCDVDKDYVLTTDELGNCLEQSTLKELNLTKANASEVSMQLDRGSEDLTNFADYMFLRRVNLGWLQCGAGQQLSRVRLPCALKITVPGWIADDIDSVQLRDINAILKEGSVQYEDPYIGLISYIGMAHIYYYFYSFQLPYLDGTVSKKDIKRAIDFQKVPSTLNNFLIDEMFPGGLEELDFFTFAAILYSYRQFKRNAIITKFGLRQNEFLNILEEGTFSNRLLAFIDTFYVPTQEEIDRTDIKSKNFTEKDYLMTFLQTEQAENPSNLYFPKNEFNRKIVYNIFNVDFNQMVPFSMYLRFLKCTWIFFNYDSSKNTYLKWREMKEGYTKYKPPIPLTPTEQMSLSWSMDFISGLEHNLLQIKEFYTFFTYRSTFENIAVPNFISFVSYPNLLKGLDNLGLRLSNHTRRGARQGADPAIKIPVYNFYAGYKGAMRDEILAMRFHNNEKTINETQNTVLNSQGAAIPAAA